LLEDLVHARRINLEQIADQRKTRRAGQIGEPPGGGNCVGAGL
jgi:hypothetical protein